MDCQSFFATVEHYLGDRCERPTRLTPGRQCVYEFFHPRIPDALGTDGVAATFNRSGVVWAPPEDRLGVRLRVPESHGDAVSDALAGAPLSFERTDHRGVVRAGEVVTVLHYAVSATDVSPEVLEATLSTLADALAV